MKKVLSLILALAMLVASMAITVNATDDQTITLDGDRVETSVISCAGTLTIEGKGSLICPGINANKVIFNSGYIQINGKLNVTEIILNGSVVNLNCISGSAINEATIIAANAGIFIGNSNITVFRKSNLTLNGMNCSIGVKAIKELQDNENDNQQLVIAKNLIYTNNSETIGASLDSTYVYMIDSTGPFIPSNTTFSNGNLFYMNGTNKEAINISNAINGSGTIVGLSVKGTTGLELSDNNYVNEDFCLVSNGTSGINTVYPNSFVPTSDPKFELVGEIVNHTKNSVTIAYKIIKNGGVCGVVLKPIFSGQNIDVFIDKNALGNDWSDIVSSSNYIYELSSANQSTQTGTNLAIITYTNIKTNDTFGLEVTYAPDDSGTFTTNTNNINIQALSHQAVFHFMYKDTEIKRVTHTNVEVETTLTDLNDLVNNVQWFKQGPWCSDIECQCPITYMPNSDTDIYCNYLFDVKVGNLDGNNTVTANDLLLLRKYIVSDTDNYIFIKNEDDAFNESKSYNLSKNYVFLCNANVNKVNNPTNNDIDEADVVALSQAISEIQSYKYKLNDDSTMVISRK